MLLILLLAPGDPVAVRAAMAHRDIVSSGPLAGIFLGVGGSLQVAHSAHPFHAFSPPANVPADAGTLLVVDNQVYAPDFDSHTSTSTRPSLGPYTPFTPVSQSPVLGSGTAADPYRVDTVLDVGSTGLRITQTDSYVVGHEAFRTDIQVANLGKTSRVAILYRAADCFLESEFGYGMVDATTGAVACTRTPNNSPPGRIIQLLPITGGNNYYEARYDQVWGRIRDGQPFADLCRCGEEIDNAVGISWYLTIPPGGQQTRSHLTAFSLLGTLPLTMSKSATTPVSAPNAPNGYTIRVTNPNPTDVTLTSIADVLPAGFAYVAGSTSGVTTANPSVAGPLLTWNGAFTVPGGSSTELRFNVTVAAAPGMYTNRALANAAGNYTVAPTGDVAPIIVQVPPTSTPTLPPTATPSPTQTVTATACPTTTFADLIVGPGGPRAAGAWLSSAGAPAVVGGAAPGGPTLLERTAPPAPAARPQSHYRSTQLTWARAGPATAEFELTTGARRSYYQPPPNLGDPIDPVRVHFGDGTSSLPMLNVVFVDVANDYFLAEGRFTHEYRAPGRYIAAVADCCRLEGPHINNPGDSFRIEALVDFSLTSASPVSSIQPIVDCPRHAECTFAVPAVGPGGAVLRYRLATAAEAADPSDGFVQPGPPHAPSPAAIDALTGVYRWNTSGATLSPKGDTLYSTQVVVEAVVGGTVAARIGVDFFIRLSASVSNQPPAFIPPTPVDGAVLNVAAGQLLEFTVAAADPDPGDTVSLTLLGRPAGATFAPVLGNPATGTFRWTPAATESVVLTLGAQDQTGLGATPRSVTIRVYPPGCVPTATTTGTATPASASLTPSSTATETPIVRVSLTPTPNVTATPSGTPTRTPTPSPTPTPSSSATRTPTRTGTPTPTAAATATASPTPVATATSANVGGRGLKLTSMGNPSVPFARLDWIDGAVETGYYVLRYAPPEATIPLHELPLLATAASFVDSAPPHGRIACYLVVPLGGTPPSFDSVLGFSDLLCQFAGTRSATGAPGQFSVRLAESPIATLSWTAPGGQTAYVLVAVTFDGAPPRLVTFLPDQTSATDATGGQPTCYALLALAGEVTTGYTDVLCAVPGVGTLGSASAATRAELLQPGGGR